MRDGAAPRQIEYRNWQDTRGNGHPAPSEILDQFKTWPAFANAAGFQRMGNIDLARWRGETAAQEQANAAAQQQRIAEQEEVVRQIQERAEQGEEVWFQVPVTMTCKTTITVKATSAKAAADQCSWDNIDTDTLVDMAKNPDKFVVHTKDVTYGEYQ